MFSPPCIRAESGIMALATHRPRRGKGRDAMGIPLTDYSYSGGLLCCLVGLPPCLPLAANR